jgi:anaerobic magnesium-protoporphyrin IX monomethyl ester cyclase
MKAGWHKEHCPLSAASHLKGYQMKVLLASPESEVWTSRKHIPLGLGYLASMLRANGHQVGIYDAAIEDEPLETVARRGSYELLGISAVTPLIVDAWNMAKEGKRLGMTTVLGGPHLTLMPEESVGPEHPEVDYVIQGEAEESILEFVDALEGRRAIETVHGLYWRKSATSRANGSGIAINPPAGLIPDLDAIPYPAHDLYKIVRYTNLNPLTDGLDIKARAYTIMTSRGCPYKCTYCSKPITGDTWRPRSVENVIGEWRWLVRDLRATEIGLTDDIWNLKLDRAKDLCRALIAEGLNTVPWTTVHGMKVNHTDPELFRLMKQAGCKRVGFGVESGDPYILRNVIKKSQSLDMVRNAFRWAREADLETMGFFIYGMPQETENTMEKTTRLALELDPDLAHFMLATPYPGTEMYDVIRKYGNIFADKWEDYAIQSDKARFTMPDYDPDLVVRKWKEAYRRFYLYRPKRVWQKVSKKSFWTEMPSTLANARRFFLPDNVNTIAKNAASAPPH